jgi:hypothetical protein
MKSGLVLFHEAMENFTIGKLQESFELFERPAAKEHEESIWIVSVVKDVEMEKSALKKAFAKTEEPLGWYFAGELSGYGREQFDFYKKSAEAGCSWGQAAYGWYFTFGQGFVEQDENVYVEWMEKAAANRNNPEAIYQLGQWFRGQADDKEKAVSYFRWGAELGEKVAMKSLAQMLRDGEGCAVDLRQAVLWSAKVDSDVFWDQLRQAKRALESRATEDLDCDFNQLCYSLGWGLYWYKYGSMDWRHRSGKEKAFGNRCVDFYCSCVELQQKSIFTFLSHWNRTTGVKGPGQMIAQMAWEGREDNLVQRFEESDGEEPETK